MARLLMEPERFSLQEQLGSQDPSEILVISDGDEFLGVLEQEQLKTWIKASYALGGEDVGRQCEDHLPRIFKRRDFSRLMPQLVQLFLDYSNGKMPEDVAEAHYDEDPIEACRRLDDHFTRIRRRELLKAVEEKRVWQMPGACDYIRRLHEMGFMVGLYTSTPRGIAEPVLGRLLGEEVFDLIEYRKFGNEIPESKKKPHAFGWLELGRDAGILPAEAHRIWIGDDSQYAVKEALEAGVGLAIALIDGHADYYVPVLKHFDDRCVMLQELTQID